VFDAQPVDSVEGRRVGLELHVLLDLGDVSLDLGAVDAGGLGFDQQRLKLGQTAVLSPITEVRAVYSVSTVADDRPSESEMAESAALSERIDVAIDQ
jgi:hypothetical protein